MIIIPTYNERENIRELVARIRAVAPALPIFFMDDNSPDGTADAVRELQQRDPNIRLRVRARKSGLGSAYREAFQIVLDQDLSDYIITMDADLSHPPESIVHIVELLKFSPVVVGSRYTLGGKIENWSTWRRILSRGANLYARLLSGVPVRDLTAGFIGCRVSALRIINLQRLDGGGYAFLVQLKYLLHSTGATIYEHPITFTERREGKSKMSFKIMLEGAVLLLKIAWQRMFGT